MQQKPFGVLVDAFDTSPSQINIDTCEGIDRQESMTVLF